MLRTLTSPAMSPEAKEVPSERDFSPRAEELTSNPKVAQLGGGLQTEKEAALLKGDMRAEVKVSRRIGIRQMVETERAAKTDTMQIETTREMVVTEMVAAAAGITQRTEAETIATTVPV